MTSIPKKSNLRLIDAMIRCGMAFHTTLLLLLNRALTFVFVHLGITNGTWDIVCSWMLVQHSEWLFCSDPSYYAGCESNHETSSINLAIVSA